MKRSPRAALSLMLATALVTTPLKLVLVQASQQEANSIQQPAAQDSSGHRLIRVPPMTDRTARLVALPTSEDALAAIFAEDGSLAGPAPIPKGAEIAIGVIVGGFLILVLLALLVCGTDGSGCSPSVGI